MSAAQTAPEPEREILLNGLRILYRNQPGNPNVVVRMRIHSGAAFDLANKGGMMALLGDALFPDESTRDYVKEELGGRLDVTTTYDAIDVTISGKAANLERMIDLLRGAVLTTQLDADTVRRLREARIARLSIPGSAGNRADEAIASRLFGSFPYGHPPEGTAATVAKVERADLMFARERFLNADNATIAVIGGVDKPRVIRTLRQLLGPWGKSNATVPATFRQPPRPDARVLLLDTPSSTRAEIRLAVRGLKRSDPDAVAADMLALILRERWRNAVPELSGDIEHRAYLLPGIFTFNGSIPTALVAKAVAAARQIINSAAQGGASEGELNNARRDLLLQLMKTDLDNIARMWLDNDAYDLSVNNVSSVRSADIQRVAARLFKDQPVAVVVVGNAEQLKPQFPGNFEMYTNTVSPLAKP